MNEKLKALFFELSDDEISVISGSLSGLDCEADIELKKIISMKVKTKIEETK